MQTITIVINNNIALKTLNELEEKKLISIIQKNDMDSPIFPGKPLTINEFRSWISEAEKMPTISLEEAKSTWAEKRKQFR